MSIDDVTDTTPRIQYIATAAQTDFDYAFPIFEDSDLVVDVNGTTKVLDTDYSVTGAGDDTGGTVSLTDGLDAGDIVTIYRDTEIARSSQYQQNGPFNSAAFNDDLDKLITITQENKQRFNRALRIPTTANVADADIELAPAVYAGKYLSFDSDGKPTPAVLTSSGSLTQDILTGLLQPQTDAETSAGVTPSNKLYAELNFLRYGADPSGVSTSDQAFNDAVAVAKEIPGGTIVVPPGLYSFASANTALNAVSGVIIQGAGGPTSGLQPGTRFQYTGTGTGVWFALNSAQGVWFRGIQFVHTKSGFTGTYFQCNNDGTNGDPSNCGLSDCAVGTSVGALLHLDIDTCINFLAERCTFQYYGSSGSVRGAKAAGYANANTFRDCEWFNGSAAPIQNAGPHQAWVFSRCTFEALSQATNSPAGAILSTASTGTWSGLVMEGCWLGDCGTATGTWVDGYFDGAVFMGNYISGNATGTTAFKLRASLGVAITGNSFNDLLNGIDFAAATCGFVTVKGNTANSVTNPWVNPSNCTLGTLDWGANFGFGVPSGHGFPVNDDGARVYADGTGGTAQGGIDQWGSSTVTTATGTITIFDVTGLAFPNKCTNVVGNISASANTNSLYLTPDGVNFTYTITGTMPASLTFSWQAKGN